MGTSTTAGPRIVSLDQFRGYTVAGMFLVNFFGGYQAIPEILKHHNTYCSYADTIMPQFFFAVGFAYRLTLLRRLQKEGPWSAYGHMIKRSLGLVLVGLVLYHLDGRAETWSKLCETVEQLGLWQFIKSLFERNFFQTLVHIGVTSIWVMPVIAAGPGTRIAFLLASAGIHILVSRQFYYEWVWTRPGIDGGPLGFLTWTIPLLVGSLAYDAMAAAGGRPPLRRFLFWSVVLMALGYALSYLTPVLSSSDTSSAEGKGWLAAPPFVPPPDPKAGPYRPEDMWRMSQRAGSVSYLTFATGFSLAVYLLFVLACDLGRMRIGVFRTLGQNALAAYVIHELVMGAVKPYVPKDAPLWYAVAGFGVFFGITYLFVRSLEKNGIYLKM
jgi:predicted acyltransferase